MSTEDISPTETTRLVKSVLRKAFPGSKFRVSSHNDITVEWTDDGPTVEQVQNALVKAKCAELDDRIRGGPRYRGPGNQSYWFVRYNEAERTAEAAEWEARHQEYEKQRQREQAAVNAAYKAKHAAARVEAEPIAPNNQSSDPAAFEVFEALRERAEIDVSTSSEAERQRRPSWAPPLIIEGELLDACRELGYLGADDKPIVRLWAQFVDPKKKGTVLREQRSRHPLAGIECRGFQLHAGSERGPLTSMLFEAQREESGAWRFGPRVYVSDDGPRSPRRRKWEQLIRERESAQEILRHNQAIPNFTSDAAKPHQVRIDELSRCIAEIDAKDLEDARTYRRREWLRQGAIELAKARVLDFAGAPSLQMQAASRLWGHCFNCGKELTDPISLERGIGPDCLVGKIDYIHFMAPYLGQVAPWLVPPRTITVEYIAFSSAMPLEFVNATIDEMPVDASGRRIQPVKKKPAPISEADALMIIQHCAVFGTLKTVVREFEVDVKPYAQYPIAARISFVEPRKRSWASYTITPDNLRFATVERGGQVLYDTRKTVPCDMAQWSETYRKHRDQWLTRQAEIDRENANAPAGMRTEQMGNFRDEEPDAARSGSNA
jgi:hypothetical protein